MTSYVMSFAELPSEMQSDAGGKGGTLARLYQKNYPVPEGFVIMPTAFEGDALRANAWSQIVDHLDSLRAHNKQTAFAVRSSAVAEDSAVASFAGEFETVLDVHTNEAIAAAIQQVHHSKMAERVRAYSQAKGLDAEQEIAIVIQRLIRADVSGILFTADPVTGNRFVMTGNYVYGFGEELVSGEAEPYTFILQRPKGTYTGPRDLRPFAKKLFELAARLETEFDCPQDIEWALLDNKLYLLQSRPITTLIDYDPVTGEHNSTFSGDYVWVGNEYFPDVMTPATFSLFQHVHPYEIEGMQAVGNIGGRLYMNFSFVYLLMRTFGQSQDTIIKYVALNTGFDLSKVTWPEIRVSRWKIIRTLLPIQLKLFPKQARLMRKFEEIIAANPERCESLRAKILTTDKHALTPLWHDEVFPLFFDLLMIQDKANENYSSPYISARKLLVKLLGEEEADELLVSLVGGSGQLRSLAPLTGIRQVVEGTMSRETYHQLAGHRLQQEDEIAIPRPYEDPNWLEERIAAYRADPVNYAGMVKQQAHHYKHNRAEFERMYPRKAKVLNKKLDKIAAAMERREIIRSELTRSLGVIRAWFLQAGNLLGLGDDIFFLADHEVLAALKGNTSIIEYIPNRRATYEKQTALPKYPHVISGRFDPYVWTKDPQRRTDMFDSHVSLPDLKDEDTIKGHPGSMGQAEGMVRIVHTPSEGDQLRSGEILVALSTNVGWTPLFPRAAAVVTDIGAPLSHAAIVARELGIPAVVGTGNATLRLKTGDRVRVDGGQGIVKIIHDQHNS